MFNTEAIIKQMLVFIINHECSPSKVIQIWSITYYTVSIDTAWSIYIQSSLFVDSIFVDLSFITPK